jgi:hypothetical protein
MKNLAPNDKALIRFRAEAAELLGITAPSTRPDSLAAPAATRPAKSGDRGAPSTNPTTPAIQSTPTTQP